jgi:hypothetical protein
MGIDYGMGTTNVSTKACGDTATRIRYGVISQHDVGCAWYDESEAHYGAPHCPACGAELDDDVCDGHECECGYTIDWIGDECYGDEPLSHYYDRDGYKAEAGCDGDIFITDSPYYTLCDFCSPCAPGAGYLTSEGNDCAAFCFGPDWFDGQPPHDIYDVETGELVCAKGEKWTS